VSRFATIATQHHISRELLADAPPHLRLEKGYLDVAPTMETYLRQLGLKTKLDYGLPRLIALLTL
jgi:hypothetical protein